MLPKTIFNSDVQIKITYTQTHTHIYIYIVEESHSFAKSFYFHSLFCSPLCSQGNVEIFLV